MNTTKPAIGLAAIARILAVAAALSLAGGCSVTPNQDVLNSAYPPADQAQILYADNQYAAGSTITLAKTYMDKGDAESLLIRNSSASEDIVINSVTPSDPAKFAVTGFDADTTVKPTESTSLYVAFSSTAAETATATLDIAYTASGKTRHLPLTLKCTRVIDTTAPLIALYDDSQIALVNNDSTAYDYGYTETAIPIEKTFTVKNIGQKNLSLITVTSNNDNDFAISQNPQGSTIIPGDTAILKIRRTDGTKAATATITIVSNASNAQVFNLKLSSQNKQTGILQIRDESAAEIPSTGYYDIGYVPTGTLDHTITLANVGTGNLTILSIMSGNESFLIEDAPAEGIVLPGAASTNFRLVQADKATWASAKITITTGDGTKSFYVTGGNDTINATFANTFAYKLTRKGFDFGGVNTTTEKNITFTNNGKAAIIIVGSSLSGSATYIDSTTYPLTIAAGGTGNISLTYTPTGTSWDEATLHLSDRFGRTYEVNVTGSGFSQPGSLGKTPTLWLRADRIDSGDTVLDGAIRTIDIWRDTSGNGNNATAVTNALNVKMRPMYNEGGINGRPSLTWSGIASKESMVVGSSSEKFLNTTTGTTTFVAFRTSSIEANRYILCAYNGTTTVYPTCMWSAWYFDPTDGYYAYPSGGSAGDRRLQYKFNIAGYTAASSPIYRSPHDSLTKQVKENTTYAFCMYYNQSLTGTAPNISMIVNDEPKELAFFYSNSALTDIVKYPYFGAYGLRIDDGNGGQNTLANSNDWCWSAAHPITGQTPCSPYFLQNRIATNSYNNGINTLYIGATSSATAPFQGEIAEIIMYNEPLEPTEIDAISTYLCNKYGADGL